MSWFLLVLLSSFFLSIVSLFQRLLSKDEQSDPVAYGFLFQLLTAVVVGIYASLTGFKIPDLRPLIFNLLLMTFFYAVGNWLTFAAYKTTEAAEVAVIFSTRIIWTVITAMIFLEETLSIFKILGVFLVVLGVAVIFWKRGTWRLGRGHWLVLGAAVLFGAAFTNDVYLLKNFNAASYTFFAYLLPAFGLLLLRPQSVKKLSLFMDGKRLVKMITASSLYGVFSVTVFLAYQAGGKASQISPMTQLSVVLTTVLAYLFLKEKNNLANKVLGSLLVFSGIWLLKG